MLLTDTTGYNVAMPGAVLTATLGPFVTGVMLQQLLLGIFCVQVYDYWQMSPADTTFNRVVVVTLTVLAVLQGTMDYINLYRNTVTYYGDFTRFDQQTWSLFWGFAVTAIIGSVSQIFFLKRCYDATKNKVMLVFLGLAIGISLGFGVASSVEFQRIVRLSLIPAVPIPIIGWLSATIVTDAVTTIILMYYAKPTFRRAEWGIIKVIRVVGGSGIITALLAMINLTLYLALPGLTYHLLPQMVLGKMYAISVIITLTASGITAAHVKIKDDEKSFGTN